ncbi:hypothetical protein CCUS01_01694 [Colletotrichum cuscutae]|uniref:Uncharacterized protein n=1 Tax=Colletotrichum cuscutae TaxID=1209917 RepID=A0AAI9XR74_9PEZI|nr:hypothetical protein CCUS01_01694 [Colletotrichum cuscutae]
MSISQKIAFLFAQHGLNMRRAAGTQNYDRSGLWNLSRRSHCEA